MTPRERPHRRRRPRGGPAGGSHRKGRGNAPLGASPDQITLRVLKPASPGESPELELVPPGCARERDLDMEEVQAMLDAGELDIARDELLYLVSGCRQLLPAYQILGELALEEGNIGLAKGYFGFAYETVLPCLAGRDGGLPPGAGYNDAFVSAARGLARCLIARKEYDKGREVLGTVLKHRPGDEIARSLWAQLDERIGQEGRGRTP